MWEGRSERGGIYEGRVKSREGKSKGRNEEGVKEGQRRRRKMR